MNTAYMPHFKSHKSVEIGFYSGLNFLYEKLNINEWGYEIHNSPYYNHNLLKAFPDYKKTQRTDGYFLRPALKVYIKIGLGIKKNEL